MFSLVAPGRSNNSVSTEIAERYRLRRLMVTVCYAAKLRNVPDNPINRGQYRRRVNHFLITLSLSFIKNRGNNALTKLVFSRSWPSEPQEMVRRRVRDYQ